MRFKGSLQQGIGAYYVRINKGAWRIHRAVDMCFGGEVHEGIWSKVGKGLLHGLFISDVGLNEAVSRMLVNLGQVA